MTYIIAEAGIDHEGEPSRLTALFDAAVRAKADAFKIQYYAEGFQGAHRTLPWLDPGYILSLQEDCNNQGLDFIITPHDQWAVNMILETNCVDKVKIGSYDWALLCKFQAQAPLIISFGYSDHSIGEHVCIAAVAHGAQIIEKHLTLERNVEGRNDTWCSLLPEEWPPFVDKLRETEICCA